MMMKQLIVRERLLEVIRILQEHTDEKTMLTNHEIHGYFPEHLQVGIGAVHYDVHSLENSTAFPVIAIQPSYSIALQRKMNWTDQELFKHFKHFKHNLHQL